MEPTSPVPHGSPEMGPPQRPLGPESLPQHSPEMQPMPERPAPEERRSSHDGDGAAIPTPTPVVPPKPDPAVSTQPQDPALANDDNPLVAADEDLIEKEWVDRAKKIIAETKHDPHEQERAISRLQADYLMKRYGREVKIKNGD